MSLSPKEVEDQMFTEHEFKKQMLIALLEIRDEISGLWNRLYDIDETIKGK